MGTKINSGGGFDGYGLLVAVGVLLILFGLAMGLGMLS